MNIFDRKCPFCGKEKQVYEEGAVSGRTTYVPCKCEIKEDELRKAEAQKKIAEGKRIYRDILIRESGLVGRLTEHCFEAISGHSKAFEAVNDFAKHFIADERQENLLLIGSVGTGKTMLAAAIIRYICENCSVSDKQAEKCYDNPYEHIHSPYCFLTAINLFTSAQNDMLNKSNETVQRCKNSKLLVIDDIGTNEKISEFKESTLLDIIDSRYVNKLPTIITSNLNAEQLKGAIGQRSYDRLKDGATIITISEQSHRKPKNIIK